MPIDVAWGGDAHRLLAYSVSQFGLTLPLQRVSEASKQVVAGENIFVEGVTFDGKKVSLETFLSLSDDIDCHFRLNGEYMGSFRTRPWQVDSFCPAVKICTREYNPVCAFNHTFSNKCLSMSACVENTSNGACQP